MGTDAWHKDPGHGDARQTHTGHILYAGPRYAVSRDAGQGQRQKALRTEGQSTGIIEGWTGAQDSNIKLEKHSGVFT